MISTLPFKFVDYIKIYHLDSLIITLWDLPYILTKIVKLALKLLFLNLNSLAISLQFSFSIFKTEFL